MKRKLATKTLVYAMAASMLLGGVPFGMGEPIVASATTYETDESLKPDASNHVILRNLSELSSKEWNYDSTDIKHPAKIKWDDANHVLTIQNLDLDITNKNVGTWLCYYLYEGTEPLTVRISGTNNLKLNGNTCFIQSTKAPIIFENPSTGEGAFYVTMNPIEDSKTPDECHFVEAKGAADLTASGFSANTAIGLRNVILSVVTKGTNTAAYTNVYGNGDIVLDDSTLASSIEASSSKMSCNAIATNGGDLIADENSMISARCNVPDATVPYFVINQAINLGSGKFVPNNADIYVTNVNGHVINASNCDFSAYQPAATCAPVIKTEDGKEVLDVMKVNIGTNTNQANNIRTLKGRLVQTEGADTPGNADDDKFEEDGKFLFASESAFATDASAFIKTATDEQSKITYLTYAQSEQNKTYYFNQANVSGIPDYNKTKTIMSNRTMALTAASSDALAGVSYENGDIVISVKGDIKDARANNKLFIDGKAIDMDEWGYAITLDDKYVAIKLEGGTVTLQQPGVYYYVLSKEFAQFIGVGTHDFEIHTSNGIIKTQITIQAEDGELGDSTGSVDEYGKIISVTQNEAGDYIYTYDTGVVRVATRQEDGTFKNVMISWKNGDTLVVHEDGSSTLTKADGSTIHYDKDGNIVDMDNKPGTGDEGGDGDDGDDEGGAGAGEGSGTGDTSSDANALDLAISTISDGFTKAPVTDAVLTSMQNELKTSVPTGFEGALIALTDVNMKTGDEAPVANPDGKYSVQFNVASIDATDKITTYHQLSNGSWEQVAPTTTGNGYIVAQYDSFSPIAIVRLTEKKAEEPTTPVASEVAKGWDGHVTSINAGFTHAPITDDTNINAADTAMRDVKGNSTDIYTMRVITTVAKDANAADGTVELGLLEVAAGDTVLGLAKQSDNSWKNLNASVNTEGKVTFNSADLGTGIVAVFEGQTQYTFSGTATDVDLAKEDSKLEITINPIGDVTGDIEEVFIDGKKIERGDAGWQQALGSGKVYVSSAALKDLALGEHTVTIKLSNGTCELKFKVTNSANAGGGDDTGNNAGNNSGNNAGNNSGNNAGNNASNNSGNNASNNSGNNSGNNTSNNASNNSGNNTSNNSGNNASNNSGNKASNNASNNSGNNTSNNAANNSGNKASNNSGNNASNNTSNNSGNNAANNSSGNNSGNNVAAGEGSSQSETPKSAQTGQDPVRMFITYFLSGIGLK